MGSIHVGNLSVTTTEDELRQAFSQHGAVAEVNIIKDRETGRSRGFAFVEMSNSNEAANAIKVLNLHQMGDRSITVNEARPKTDRSRRSGGAGLRR
jgi:RNA recognition motif-containing protein